MQRTHKSQYHRELITARYLTMEMRLVWHYFLYLNFLIHLGYHMVGSTTYALWQSRKILSLLELAHQVVHIVPSMIFFPVGKKRKEIACMQVR